MPEGIDGTWDGQPTQDWIRDRGDGNYEHCVFDVQPNGAVVVSVQVMQEIMSALGFRRVDTVTGDVLGSTTHTD
jgi:hypothetical protein